MKISSASKKVLASALSAAMVVAFSPAVALAATNTGDNAYYGEEEISHNLDNGVVTKAPTCTTEGIMTYTCADGDGYTVVAPIAKTKGHTLAVDTASKFDVDGTLDGFNWASDGAGGWNVTGYFKCSEGELSQSATVAAVKTAETPATFYAAGSTTWTAKVKDGNGTEYTTTKTVTNDVIAPGTLKAEADSAAPDVFTDGYSLARIKLSNGTYSQVLTAATASKIVTPATEQNPGVTEYTAAFDMPEGVFFGKNAGDTSDTSNTDLYSVDATSISGVTVKVKAGKLYVSKQVTDTKNGTAHVVATAGEAAGHVATDTEGNETYSDAGVTITYNGAGSILDGTASVDKGVWTIEVKCSGTANDGETVAEEQVAKVTKATCPGKTLYTVEYNGGKFELLTDGDDKAAHTYVAGETKWAYNGTTKTFYNKTVYTCPVDGDYYTVKMDTAGNVQFKHNGSETLASTDPFYGLALKAAKTDTSVKATHTAAGTISLELSLTNADSASAADKAALAEAIAKVGITSQSIKLPTAKLIGTDTAQINWVGTSSAVVTVKCADADIYDVKTYNLTATHVNAKLDDSANFTPGYTIYSADITLPEGVTEINAETREVASTDTAGAVFYDAKTKTYSVKKVVADKVTSVVTSATPTDGLYATSDVSKWTVSDDGKAYGVTAISVADIAHSKKAPYVQKAYTLTYNNGKTVTIECTGNKLAHNYAVDHFVTTLNADKTVKTVQAVLVCPDCGQTVTLDAVNMDATAVTKYEVKALRDYTAVIEGSTVTTIKNGTVIGTYNIGKYMVTGSVYSQAPTYEWTVSGRDVTAKATFISADGKMKVTVPCTVALVDAATCTYKATIEKENIPEGYTGAVSETKVINIHEGHAMIQTAVKKATTSAAGYTEYWCNVCQGKYMVAIAKDNFKLASSSKTFKASALKKAKKTVTIKAQNAKGKVSYKASTAAKKAGVTVSSKGKVTVKKGTKKGTYKITVTSAATSEYAKATKTFSVKVK